MASPRAPALFDTYWVKLSLICAELFFLLGIKASFVDQKPQSEGYNLDHEDELATCDVPASGYNVLPSLFHQIGVLIALARAYTSTWY